MNCPHCKRDLENFNIYFMHLRFVHGITDYFICPYSNCKRVYHLKHSLKRHVSSYHAISECDSHSDVEKTNSISDSTPLAYNVENISDSTPQVHSANECDVNTEIAREETLFNFKSEVYDVILALISQLYNILDLPRSVIQKLTDLMSELFMSKPVTFLLKRLHNLSEETSAMVAIITNVLNDFNTDYKRMENLKHTRSYVKPTANVVGVSEHNKLEKGNIQLALKKRSSYLIPLRKSLKIFLELPGVLEIILNYQKNVCTDNDIIRNIVNGTCWKTTLKNLNEDTVLPLTVYYDDFESGNPLGSHAGNQKIGAVYVSIAVIPPDVISRLENVLPALIFYTRDRTEFGNNAVFGPLIEEFKFLQTEGIEVQLEETTIVTKFCVANISGDNLGMHSVLGLNESFSSIHFCRFCTTPKSDTKTDTKERIENIRKESDYNLHCDGNVGIKEKCIWHVLNFHVYTNLSCDVMHDLCEGIHRYDMCLIISKLLEKKYFTLEILNRRMKYFTYLSSEKNYPPPITRQKLLSGHIVFSASEMLCFVRNLRFIIGDFVPDNDPVWIQYLCLLDITQILMSQVFTSKLIDHVKYLIENYLENLIELFDCSLKPKHHFLLHYPRIIKVLGPPILSSAFKFEAKHKELKKITRSIASRKNLPQTLATRLQLNNCHRLGSKTGLSNRFRIGKRININISNLPLEVLNKSDLICVDYIEKNGIKYSNVNVLVYEYKDDNPLFYKIQNVLITDSNEIEVIFFCKKLKTIGYNAHLMAYRVEKTSELEFISLDDCYSNMPSAIRQVNQNHYVDVRN